MADSVTAATAQTVVITGAGGGIGHALAHRYARAGARIGLLDLDAERLEAMARELGGAAGPVVARACDVTSWEDSRRAMGELRNHFGEIDVLINNAGITHVSPLAATDPAVIRRVMDVNFFGALHCTLAALPSLIQRRGRIVVMSSVAGFAPLAGRCGYSASKHALHGLFDSLRAEQATNGVSVTLVCPSFVRTEIGSRALGGQSGQPPGRRFETGTPLEPEQVAEAVHRAVERRQRLLVLGAVGKLAYAATRLWPELYERIMRRKMLDRARSVAPEGRIP